MDVSLIDETIRAMCLDVALHSRAPQNWRRLSEERLLYEAALCIFGSRMVFELSLAMVDRLRSRECFHVQRQGFDRLEYERSIASVLSEPVMLVDHLGRARAVMPRFKNRLAALLATTVDGVYGQGGSFRQLLCACHSGREARESLVLSVSGFGPKQASLFLRRVGFCSELAVLDIHVIDYLRLAHGLALRTDRLGSLPFYEQIEKDFQKIASGFGYAVGCVDLAIWLTMRVAKREAYI